MKQFMIFKNPEEASSDDDLDELGGDMEGVVENDNNDSDYEYGDAEGDTGNEEEESINSSTSDSEFHCDEDSSSDLRDSDTDDDISVDETLATPPTVASSAPGKSNVNTSSAAADKSNGDAPKSSSAIDLYEEDDEEDETVRAMIAAIKKPRSSPQEIKLDDFITDICFHPENDIIALATITGDVYLYTYSTEDNMLLRTIEVHAKACRDVEFSDDGRNLLTCSKDKSIMITDMVTEKLKKFYESAHEDAINKLYVLDENLFASGDDAGTVKLWDLRTKDAIFALKEVEDYVTQIISNEAKKLLLVTSGDGYLSTFNIGARKLYVQSEPYEEELNCMGIYRGDSKLVVGTSKGNLYTYNWGQFGYHCDMYPGIKTPISQMIPLTDRIGCVAGEEGIIRACHIAPYRNLGIVGQHSMPVECMDINTSGELIASSSHNNDVRFWNIKYFEEFNDIKFNEKHNPHKEKRHNLPSSKFANNSDFFADLANDE